MHPGAFEFVSRNASVEALAVIEIGSRNINGTARDHFPNATWTGLDLHPGPAVDVVIDARDYQPPHRAEMVICCEVMEHCQHWRELTQAAWRMLLPGGAFIVTAAGVGRPEHSAIDGGELQPGEWYGNINDESLRDSLIAHGFDVQIVESNHHWHDVYAVATKAGLPE